MKTKKTVLNAGIIVSLLIILSLLIIYNIQARQEEGFTELYFVDHQDLPITAELGKNYDFSFGIHNLENKLVEYNYVVSIGSNIIDQGQERLEHNEVTLISKNFKVSERSDRSLPVSIRLLDRDQEIHFWVDIE